MSIKGPVLCVAGLGDDSSMFAPLVGAHSWCRVNGGQYDGRLDQTRLFGVYPDDILED